MTDQTSARAAPRPAARVALAGFAADEGEGALPALSGAGAIFAEPASGAFSRVLEREAARLLGAEQASLYLLADFGVPPRRPGEREGEGAARLRSPQALWWRALVSGRLVHVRQPCAEPPFPPTTEPPIAASTRSVLAAPVMSTIGPVGVLKVASRPGAVFGEEDECRLTALCNIVAAALDTLRTEGRLKAMISRYMDPRLAAHLLKAGPDVLRGRSIRATVLFCDLRNSTGLAEELGAQRMVSLLNEFFTLMDRCLRAEGALVDKFIGDAVLAAFGVPEANGDDEDRAVRAAIAMTKALRQWNEARAASALPELAMGIGINTDIIVAGNVGSSVRMDYTVTGAGVSLAARLEAACKRQGAAILVSEHTVRRLRNDYRIRPAGAIEMPGRPAPVTIYEILGDVS